MTTILLPAALAIVVMLAVIGALGLALAPLRDDIPRGDGN